MDRRIGENMAISTCPDCKRPVDIDGFVEHHPALFYCECGDIYDMKKFGELTIVPKEEVDLSGLKGYPSKREWDYDFNTGIFIKKSRWKTWRPK